MFINADLKFCRKNSKNIFIPFNKCSIITMYQINYGVKAMEKIKLTIANDTFNISTDDNLEYVAQLGEELNEKINALMAANSRISVTQAAVVTALEYADSAKKSENASENLRKQIQEYIEDVARARTDVEISKREIERLNKEIASLKAAR